MLDDQLHLPVQPQPLSEADFLQKLKTAKLRTAVVAAIPTLIILIFFLSSLPVKNTLIDNCIAGLLFTILPFAFIYAFVFRFGFGKKLIAKMKQDQCYFESLPHIQREDDDMIDTFNAANGFGPGIGIIMAPRHKDY